MSENVANAVDAHGLMDGKARWTAEEHAIFRRNYEAQGEDVPFQERVALAQVLIHKVRRKVFTGPSRLPWAMKAYAEGKKKTGDRTRAHGMGERQGRGARKTKVEATKMAAAAAAVRCEGATGGDAVTLEAALDALVSAIVARVETKLAARLASVQVGGRSEKTVGGVKPVGVRSMSDQQLRDRIGLARARGDHGEVKSCVNELKRRDGIANRFATANNGAED